MSVLLGVIVLFAIVTLFVAVQQAMAMVRVAPKNAQLASFLPLGWWKFAALEAKAGPDAASYLTIYKRAVIAFLVFLVLGLILSGFSVNRSADITTAQSSISDLRVSAQLAFTQFPARRVAAMPGAPSLES